MDKDSADPRALLALTDANCVITGQKKVNKVSKCLEKCNKYDRENLAILCCKMSVHAETRKNISARAQILKMLTMA